MDPFWVAKGRPKRLSEPIYESISYYIDPRGSCQDTAVIYSAMGQILRAYLTCHVFLSL